MYLECSLCIQPINNMFYQHQPSYMWSPFNWLGSSLNIQPQRDIRVPNFAYFPLSFVATVNWKPSFYFLVHPSCMIQQQPSLSPKILVFIIIFSGCCGKEDNAWKKTNQAWCWSWELCIRSEFKLSIANICVLPKGKKISSVYNFDALMLLSLFSPTYILLVGLYCVERSGNRKTSLGAPFYNSYVVWVRL